MPQPDPTRFAIIPIPADASGTEVKFPTAIMTGDMSTVMARIKDSKQMREDLRISNEADQVRRAKAQLDQREADLAEREADLQQAEDLIRQLVGKVDDFEAQLNSYEEQKLAEEEVRAAAELSAAEFALPPGSADEDKPTHHPTGELHSVEPKELTATEDNDGEGDLPRWLTEKVQPDPGTAPELPRPREPSARAPVGTNW